MKIVVRAVASAFLFAAAAFAFAAGDVVVLKGGSRIELREPPVRQGNVVLLTRSDGTLLSVSAGEIDWKATADARNAARIPAKPEQAMAVPAETPAQAARARSGGPKARVKLTDADVGHAGTEESPPVEKKDAGAPSGGGRLEVLDYAQENSGGSLVVHGTIRNPGAMRVSNARMTVTAMDEKGEKIASAEAGLSNGMVDPGGIVSFSVTIPVSEKFIGSIRFAPQWLASALPGSGPAPSPTPSAPSPAPARATSAQNPAPAPTPYGQGTLYAAPVASASTTPPADGNTGYIPGMSSPENQPKPPQ